MIAKQDIPAIAKELAEVGPEAVIAWAVKELGAESLALATSFGAEDQVLAVMVQQVNKRIGIFTLDTGRLPQPTYDTMSRTRTFLGCRIEALFPDREQVEALTMTHGPNLFYESMALRKQCCQVRKVVPLQRKLATLKGWICGLRREQSVTRAAVSKVEWDEGNGLVKFNPLADWSEAQVWACIKEKGIPYNPLHDLGYPSIGCAPCTRVVAPGGDIRSGRWWWEDPTQKECGLHLKQKR